MLEISTRGPTNFTRSFVVKTLEAFGAANAILMAALIEIKTEDSPFIAADVYHPIFATRSVVWWGHGCVDWLWYGANAETWPDQGHY